MNQIKCEKCKKSLADFTENSDWGDGTGADEYFCHDCEISTVMPYKKVYEEPYVIEWKY